MYSKLSKVVTQTLLLLVVTGVFAMASAVILPRCTIILNPYSSLSSPENKLGMSQFTNPNLKRRKIIKIKPSQIQSDYNSRRTTILVDLREKNYYQFVIDEKGILQLQHITRDGDIIEPELASYTSDTSDIETITHDGSKAKSLKEKKSKRFR